MILQWNIRSINQNKCELLSLIKEINPLCVCLNETFLKNPVNFTIKCYTSYHTNLDNQSGNLILIRKDIPYTPLMCRTDLNALAIRVKADVLITICSIYLNPGIPLDPIQLNDLITQLPQPFLLVGDFNARNTFWHDRISNPRGNQILDIVLNEQLHILNTESPTHYDQRTNGYSHIDLSVCTQDLVSGLFWDTYPDLCGSDHYPILIQSLEFTPEVFRKRWKYYNVDWPTFTLETANFPSYDQTETVETNLETLKDKIYSVAEKYIPFSATTKVKCPVPWWNKDCQVAKKARSRAHRRFKQSRSDYDYIEYKKQCSLTKRIFREAQRVSWKSYVSSINENTPISKIWKKIHKISGKPVKAHVPTLFVDNEIIYDSKEVASAFAKSLSNISKGSSSPSFQPIKQNQESQQLNFAMDEQKTYNKAFSMDELLSALSSCSNTAPGEDMISFEILKHTDVSCHHFILELYNSLWVEELFPQMWNTAISLPFLKPGKDPRNPSSYRPIALTCCLCKLLEKMINNRLMWYLEYNHHLSPSQFGYRKLRSTLDPLTLLDTDIGKAFAENKYVTAIFFDLEKAYDTTWRYHILKQLHVAGLRGHLPISIKNFLTNRSFKVSVNGVLSDEYPQFEGVPQGSVLSTTLFILAINDLAKQVPAGVQCSLYVDDFAIWLIYDNVQMAERVLQRAVNNIVIWSNEHGFTVSAAKTVAITFTRKRNIPNIRLHLNNNAINFVRFTRFLGMYFDQRMTWTHHINHLREQCNKSLSLLKKLSHTKWGSDRSTLLYLHQTLILSKLDYGSHLYASASRSRLAKLDPIHNSGLRLATGAFKSSPVKSLYVDTALCSLGYRRAECSLNYYSRILRIPSKLSRLVTNATIPVRMGPRKFYPFAVRLKVYLEYYSIPPLQVFVHSTYSHPQWDLERANCCKEMLAINKDQFSPGSIKQLFLEHQESHEGSIPIYTDGSKSNMGVGYAVVMPDRVIHKRLPSYSSVYSAELMAISVALTKIPRQRNLSYTIYSDSQSAIRSIDAFNSAHPCIIEIQEKVHALAQQYITINMCWVPAHVGVEGNEAADKAAKAATLNVHLMAGRTFYKDTKSLFQTAIKRKWNQEWEVVPNNHLRNIKKSIDPWKSSTQKVRSHEVILSRLRIGHTKLTHKFLMEGGDPPICESCQVRVTVKHFLIECPKYLRERNLYFGRSPKINIILGDDFNIAKLVGFLSKTNIFNQI